MVTTNSTTNSQFGGTAAANADKVSTQAATSANKDMFTKLLVAQIQNQDPLSPQDPTAYVNQLSQLSQTEALQNLSSTSTASATVLQSLQTLAMGGQVGSDVTVATNTLKLDGSKVSGTVQLNGLSAGTSLVLTGTDGKQHTIDLGPGTGAQPFTIDPDALGLAPGSYTIQAKPSDGSTPTVEVAARLNSVHVNGTKVVLQVANVGEVDPSSVTGFNGKTGS
ncbi:flagellar basal body rod modification protein [Massilia sp. TW-1]|jgi:flagellar basal-body rod modification protein FlgD|uniref:Basal-body rod modification protein FlgD n=1 Tax=Telluria antibiotica TaxID=2717319 RepID=A0ABX0PL78_9BURK|nr:flagellar hook capping FlgD N-terminal domain-containing protein [Telluria antibiotica]NIA57183.1 flagellar basal body rod modification protein [Telluria antibiotica]